MRRSNELLSDRLPLPPELQVKPPWRITGLRPEVVSPHLLRGCSPELLV